MGHKCLIWGTPAEVVYQVNDRYWVKSTRAGGRYEITGSAQAMIDNGYLDEAGKAKLTTVLIDQRRDHDDVPLVRPTLLEEVKDAPLLTPVSRADRLLKYIATKESSSPGRPVRLGYPIVPGALAHSESWNDGQMGTLVQHLVDERWLTLEQTLDELQCTVTVSGHDHLAEAEQPKGQKAFVAMWFDPSMNEAYRNGIEPGIRDAGFVPIRIDEKKDANRIDDDIIDAIREARFVVADMTHGRDGVRGSVYFEAGFARGCGLKVIYCCRRDCFGGLPFDTRQYHHIAWDTPQELRRELAEKIRARIGSSDSGASRGAPPISSAR